LLFGVGIIAASAKNIPRWKIFARYFQKISIMRVISDTFLKKAVYSLENLINLPEFLGKWS